MLVRRKLYLSWAGGPVLIMRTEVRKGAQHIRYAYCICRFKSNYNTIASLTIPRTIAVFVMYNTLDRIYIYCIPNINARSPY